MEEEEQKTGHPPILSLLLRVPYRSVVRTSTLKMNKLSILAISAAAISLTNAFCVDFNSADHCTGTVVGKFIGSGVTGCQTAFQKPNSSESIPGAGLSSNVIIQPQANDTKHGVAFYGRDNCEVLIGFGNVQVCTGVGAWASFEVITIDQADDQLTNLDPAPILSIPPNATETASAGDHLSVPSAMLESMSAAASGTAAGSAAGTATGTAANRETGIASMSGAATTAGALSTTSGSTSMSASTAAAQSKRSLASPKLGTRMAHGSVQEYHGRLFKYHQVAARAWRGVPLEQWNDGIHRRVARDHTITPLWRHEPFARSYPQDIGSVGGSGRVRRGRPSTARGDTSPRGLSSLEKRAIPPSKCNLVRTCMIDSGDNDGFGISNAGPALLSAIDSLNGPGDHWQFLEHPFVVEVVDGSGSSQGYIYAQTRQEHSEVATCSDRGNEADAFTSALEMGVDGTTVSDMRVDLKLLTGTGVTNTLFVSTRKAGNSDMRIHPICEAIQLFD